METVTGYGDGYGDGYGYGDGDGRRTVVAIPCTLAQ